MRDRETIDAELRLIASARGSVGEHGGQPAYHQVDRLLDERLGHAPEEIRVVADARRDLAKTHKHPRRRSALLRFGPLLALPLSLIAVVGAVVVMFTMRHPDPAAPPAVDPPPSAQPNPAPPKAAAPPQAPVSQADIVDTAFVDVLTREGVPVPSREYALTQGHAVCDFLAHQSNFAQAVSFVQRSTIWDANQSTDVTAGAVVSYCPQYEFANQGDVQQTYQKALTDMQAIQGDLQGIGDGLKRIGDGVPPFPGSP
jgi:hypothetical protein